MDDVFEQLQPVIEPGETVLWSGRSDSSVLFSPADGFLIPYGLFFLGFSIFWQIGASHAPSPGFALFGLPILLIGVYYAVGRFLVKWWLKRRTAYAITNRRAIVVVGPSRVYEAALNGGSRVTKLSRNRSHVSVTFNGAIAKQFSFFGSRSQLVPNTGLDPFDFAHRFPVAFYDVTDVDGLRAALARVSATEPQKLGQ